MRTLQNIEHAIQTIPNPNRWQQSLQVLLAVIHTLNRAGMKRHATVLTYQTLLAIVPLLAILFTLLKMFGIDAFLRELLMEGLAPLGQSGADIGHYLLQFIQNTETNLLGSVSAIFLLFGIFTLLSKIDQALNDIWGINSANDWKGQILGYSSAILLTIVIGLVAITLNVSAKKDILQTFIGNTDISLIIVTSLSKTASILFTALMLAILYSATINIKVRRSAAFAGGLFCALLWIPLTFFFAKIISVSSNYSVIYSSFASVIILLIWLNVLWLLFLSGSLVAYFFQFPALLKPYSKHMLNAAEIAFFMQKILEYMKDENLKNEWMKDEKMKDNYTREPRNPVSIDQLINNTHLTHTQLAQVLNPLVVGEYLSTNKKSLRHYAITTQGMQLTTKKIKIIAYGKINREFES